MVFGIPLQSDAMSITIPHNYLTSLPSLHTIPPTTSSQYRMSPVTVVKYSPKLTSIKCSAKTNGNSLRTCKNCKTQYDPLLNNPRACRFHTAHFGGETKRKFESVYAGGTMDTPDSGKVYQYWHCCGSEDPLDPGCTDAPHSSYDD